jgi:hypothetical protein
MYMCMYMCMYMSVCHEKRHRDRERERLGSVGRNNRYTHGACWGRYTLEFDLGSDWSAGGRGVARASYPKGGRKLCSCDSARRTHYGRGVGYHALEGALRLVQQAGPEMRARGRR